MTAAECTSLGKDYLAYKAAGRCLYAAVYGEKPPTLQKDGSYECEDNFYLQFKGSKVTCVESEDKCDGLYML